MKPDLIDRILATLAMWQSVREQASRKGMTRQGDVLTRLNDSQTALEKEIARLIVLHQRRDAA